MNGRPLWFRALMALAAALAACTLISPQDTSSHVWQELRGIRDSFICW